MQCVCICVRYLWIYYIVIVIPTAHCVHFAHSLDTFMSPFLLFSSLLVGGGTKGGIVSGQPQEGAGSPRRTRTTTNFTGCLKVRRGGRRRGGRATAQMKAPLKVLHFTFFFVRVCVCVRARWEQQQQQLCKQRREEVTTRGNSGHRAPGTSGTLSLRTLSVVARRHVLFGFLFVF